MDRDNRPVGRQEHVTSGNGSVEKHGSGLGLGGPQGNKDGYGGRPGEKGGKKESGDSEDRGIVDSLVQAAGGNSSGENLAGELGSLAGTFLGGHSSGGNGNNAENILNDLTGNGSGGNILNDPTGGASSGHGGGNSGNGGGNSGNGGGNSGNNGGGNGGRNPLSRLFLVVAVIIVLFVVFGGGRNLLSGLLGGTGATGTTLYENTKPYGDTADGSTSAEESTAVSTAGSGYYLQASDSTNTGVVNTDVASGAREKYTRLLGDGKDTVTLMIYMCGTDLESKSGMATSDLSEMTKATIDNSRLRILVFTGGCTQWQNSVVSNSTNQIYQIESGGVEKLADDLGSSPMTDPENLGQFIVWCKQNFPASRYGLICWDHGGGTLSGYCYDEKFPNSGSMTIDKIGDALKEGGCQFDFIGFDACLMANLETAMTVEPYADYLIASEETEPGYGWYYTDFLTQLSANTSIDTLSLAKTICDTFTSDNAQRTRGDSTTLSVLDLAEESATIPEVFSAFASSLDKMVTGSDYQSVANARANTREFAASEGIDQVDLISFCDNLGTTEAKNLAAALRGIVKYNMTSSDMADAYGVSIYFPYKQLSYVSIVMNMYSKIGFDSNYIQACERFASLETGGQISAGGSSNPLDQLLGNYSSAGSDSYGSYSGANGNYDEIESLLSSFLSDRSIAVGKNVNGLTSGNSSWLDSDTISAQAKYLSENSIDASKMVWTDKSGAKVLKLTEKQWKLIQKVELNVFYDDGSGYIDLGLDNLYSFDKDGDLVGKWDGTWLALNGQIVPYYVMTAVSDGNNYSITGRIPALLDGNQLVNIILRFTNEDPDGSVIGISKVYSSDAAAAVLGKITPIDDTSLDGATLDFICDYYNYDGTYNDSYAFGSQMTLSASEKITVSNVAVSEPDACNATYRLTDVYNNYFWTPSLNTGAD